MDLKNYISLIWRWAWLIALGILVAGTASFIISKNTTPIYRSSSRLLIDQAPGTSSGNEYTQILVEQRLAQTYVELLNTDPVLQETIERLGLPYTTGQLKGKITVSAPQDTQIINIGVEDTSPQSAALIANTLGEVFITQNQERENRRFAEPISNWETRLNALGNEIESIQTQINDMGEPTSAEGRATLSRLQTNLNESQIQYTDVFNNLNQLRIDQARETSNLIQIEPAKENSAPIRPRTLTNVLLAAVVGGMMAVGIIFLIEYLDDTLKTPDHILEDTGLTTLGAIAMIKSDEKTQGLITQQAPRDPISEAYRVVRTNLSFSAVDEGLTSLLVSSASPGEGKSTTAANMAVVMAQTGKQVILVDADLRRPVQHKIFSLPNNLGLTAAILDNQTPVAQHLQETAVSNLRVLTSGPIPPNPAELLNSHRMQDVLRALKDASDIIILDTPPVLTVADASILGPQVNGAFLVIDTGETRRAAFANAAERLSRTGTHLFGAVLNKVKLDRSGYGYYYYYYSSYDYNSKPKKRRSKSADKNSKLPAWISGLIKR
ncbi:MAG: polysaccharide biosynthesis tyrosine autokinase [Chloroflexota bacterium]